MAAMYLIVALALLSFGALLGAVAAVSIAILKEGKVGSLGQRNPGRIASGARVLLNVHASGPGEAGRVTTQRQRG